MYLGQSLDYWCNTQKSSMSWTSSSLCLKKSMKSSKHFSEMILNSEIRKRTTGQTMRKTLSTTVTLTRAFTYHLINNNLSTNMRWKLSSTTIGRERERLGSPSLWSHNLTRTILSLIASPLLWKIKYRSSYLHKRMYNLRKRCSSSFHQTLNQTWATLHTSSCSQLPQTIFKLNTSNAGRYARLITQVLTRVTKHSSKATCFDSNPSSSSS